MAPTTVHSSMQMPRPTVSVVVPFRGDRTAATWTLTALGRLELRDGDELIVADNSDGGFVADLASAPIAVVRAGRERSSYHARNAGAGAAGGEWLLFVDADCVPQAALLDSYFADPIDPDVGVIGGEIAPDPGQRRFLARYARDRGFLSQTEGLHGKAGSAAASANMLVRRSAFDAVGGFVEGIRSAGDVDLCWRLCGAGWRLEYRPGAIVAHRHREGLVPFLGQVARYAAGARWLDERHPGSSSRWPLLLGLRGSARDVAANLIRGRVREATFRAVDALGLVAHNLGYLSSNRAPTI
jgi:GT2 family glycosyltransferase